MDLSRLGGTYYEKDRSVSFISSATYSYANRYVFNANFRSDGVDIIGSKISLHHSGRLEPNGTDMKRSLSRNNCPG
ncbi:hypothetical protein KUH03_11175 [Sphingobacterium sp. E70]|uniref:hypothetical protein n=1 Tax=Sphingobacterium sp. E70 TaxID=2853439 RepID=UPI00211C0226|nr:hypothetical protein [Sphingobacterium sp. E70]ULT27260.1 hypothetical protein KUH03_11175 [Sphingobacterium sp. E70]